MDKPQSKMGGRLLIAALGVFIVAKLLYILLPIEALGIPRNGDDAFYILWGGQQLRHGYDLTLPALADIRMQAALQDGVTQVQEWQRSRALFRSVGTHSPFLDLVNAAILSFGFSSKWSYAIQEICVAVFMGTGIAVFLRQLFGSLAAAAGLILLSFVFLPLRGLHHFTASELVLSLALFLWAYMLRRTIQCRLEILLPGWFVVLAIHPLGLVYLCSGLAMLFLAEGRPRDWFRPRALVIGGALLALGGAFQLLSLTLPFLGMESAFAGRGFNFSDGFFQNLSAISYTLQWMGTHEGVAIFIFAILAPFTAARGKIFQRPVLAALVAMILPLLFSLFYYYPGYSGEVFGRIFVPTSIIFAGAAGAFLAEIIFVGTHRAPVRFIAAAVLAMIFTSTALASYQRMIRNLNLKHEIIDEEALAAQIDRLPAKTQIVYLNSDISLNSILLAGGHRFGALVGPMLAFSESMNPLLNDRRPAVLAVTLPRWFNMASMNGSSALGERRYGISFEQVSKLLIRNGRSRRQLAEVYVLVTNRSSAPFELVKYDNPRSPTPPDGTGRQISIPAGHSGWVRLDQGLTVDRQSILVTLPAKKGWIEGLSFGPPEQNIRWPWMSDVQMAILERKNKGSEFKGIRFSIPLLLSSEENRAFLPLIRRRDPVMSDDSGLVFLNTIFAP